MTFKNLFVSLALGASTVIIAACATEPAASQSAAAPVAAAAPAVAAVPVATPSGAAVAESDAASAMEKKFRDAARSYKVVQRDGKTMYCKREKVIGSTIPTMQCLTEAQLRIQVENTEELKRRMNRGGGPCVQTGGGCGS
jgi:heme A synthase